MPRRIVALAVMVLMALVFGACVAPTPAVAPAGEGAAAPSGPTEITLMRFFGDCFDEFGENTDQSKAYGECGIIQTLTNAFNASQNEVVVKTLVVDWPGYTELNSNLAAGTPPDIMVLHGIRIPNYASRGLLTPLSGAFETTGIDVADWTDTARGNVEFEGELYGMPLDLHGHLWHINVGLWKEAGLVDDAGKPVLPVGEEEFLAAAKKFQEATGKPFLTTWTNGLSRNWMALVYQQNGSIENEDGSPLIDSEEGLRALNFLLHLRDEGILPDNVDGTAAQEMFLNGEVGSMWDGTWKVNFYDEQTRDPASGLKEYYVASNTQIYDKPAAWASTHAWIVPLGLQPDPVKMDAVLKFLKYLNDNNLEWARTGHLSVAKSVIAGESYNSLAHRSEYAAFATDAVIMPRQNWVTAFETVVDEEIQAAFIGQKSPEQAMIDAQSRLEDFANFGQ